MRTIRFALAAATVSVLGLSAMASAPASSPAVTRASAAAPASATAPAPATAPVDPVKEAAAKKAAVDFIRAMFTGDQKAALGFLVYTDDKNQPAIETMLGEVLAEQRVRLAVTAAFGDKAKDFPLGAGAGETADFEKELQAAAVKLNDAADGATIQMVRGPAFVLALKNGQWRVDFDKTQANIGPLPEAVELAALARRTAGYDQLAQDVAAKKFGTVEEAAKEVDKIDTAAKGAGLPPATGAAPGG